MKLRLTLLLMTVWSLGDAQETHDEKSVVRNRIGIALGIGHVRWTDKNNSPLTYKSVPKNVRLFYNLETDDAIITVDLDVRMGGLKSKEHPDRTIFFREEDYKGKKEDKKFPVGGGLLAAKFSIGAFYKTSNDVTAVGIRMQEEMFYPQGWVSSGMFNAISFTPAFLAQKIDNRHQLSATLHLPGIAYTTRLPYHQTVSAPNKTLLEGFFRNASWKGPGGYTPFGLALNYYYQEEESWGIGGTYELNSYSIRDPERMKSLSNALLFHYGRTF